MADFRFVVALGAIFRDELAPSLHPASRGASYSEARASCASHHNSENGHGLAHDGASEMDPKYCVSRDVVLLCTRQSGTVAHRH
jgi:hypothetical protein